MDPEARAQEDQGREAARAFRRQHHLGLAPLDDIVDLADQDGHDVVVVSAGAGDHGMTARDTWTGVTVIVVSNEVPSVRFRSTIAHELGHLQFPDDLQVTTSHSRQGGSEARAQSFARHLLLPVEAVEAEAAARPRATDEDLLNSLVRRYGLSPRMASIQMQHAGLVAQDEGDRLGRFTTPDLARSHGWSELNAARDAAVRATQLPRRLTELAIVAYREGRIPAPELARVLHTTVAQVRADHGEPATGRQQRPKRLAPILLSDDLSD